MPGKDEADKPRKPSGFSTLTPERVRELAAMGGKAVPNAKRAFSVDRALAAAAGRKGGLGKGRRATQPGGTG